MHNNNKITTDLKIALAQLEAGQLVAFPTETVYGLGAAARMPEAIKKVFAAKGRPADHPVIVHIANSAQLNDWAINIPDAAWVIAQHFWPGAITIILQKQPSVSNLITGGQDTIGLRIPNHSLTLELLKQFGSGIVGPSANKYGRVSPTSAEHVATDLFDQDVVILDGGDSNVGIESTILDLSTNTPIIRRLGAISAEQISSVLLQPVQIDIAYKPNLKTPGSHAAHYAPRTPLVLVTSNQLLSLINEYRQQNQKVSVLSWQQQPTDMQDVYWQSAKGDPQEFAHDLYTNLREHDQLQRDVIIIETPPQNTTWAAVLDRLTRASHKL